MLFTRLLAPLTHLPSQCAVCRAWPAQRICGMCRQRFVTQHTRCSTCARCVPEGVLRCGECLLTPPQLDACVAAVSYSYPWNEVLQDFKFHAEPSWAKTLAGLLLQVPTASQALEQADWLLPIPLSRQRLRERGYNQALLLARALARHKVQANWLLRQRHTEIQSHLSRTQRLRNLHQAFAFAPHAVRRLAGQRVVLVDDVITTGATMQAAATVLRQNGVQHITALVLARTEDSR